MIVTLSNLCLRLNKNLEVVQVTWEVNTIRLSMGQVSAAPRVA